ncbi:MAG: ABC transporter permease subunit [Planctomycetia bacterium]|nr:ABC transporter permease subunit [Planctomycetia bacterium]
MSLLRAWITLVWLSFRRLLWSGSTLMVLLPIAACTLFILRWRFRLEGGSFESFNAFSLFLMFAFASFVVPICAVAYGTASIGGDREDRTLLFLLVRPVPRPLVFFAKFFATLPLALGLVMGAFWLYCQLAGEIGALAYSLYLPAIFYMTIAYVSLFHFFAVSFRHSTIIALIYALFIEIVLGNLPGIVKRVAINYYGRSMMYAAGVPEGLERPDAQWFEPISATTSAAALAGITLVALLVALVVFQRREYTDLT